MARLSLKKIAEDITGKTGLPNENPHAGAWAERPMGRAIDGINFAKSEELIAKYRDKLIQRGIPISSHMRLGKGSYGSAYSLPGGTVLKVTKDKTEAIAAKNLAGKNFKHVYKVLQVFQLDSTGVYVIHQEHLFRMSAQRILDKAGLERVVQEAIDNYREGDPKEKVIAWVSGQIGPELNESEKQEIMKLTSDMMDGLDELSSIGIEFIDYHFGNVLWRNKDKNYVFIDIGESKSPNAEIEKID